jgi:predicted nucleotidyltransferase
MIDATPVETTRVEQTLSQTEGLAFAVLVGSRAEGSAHAHSDWDIAIQWARTLSLTEQLRRTELLRYQLRLALGVEEDKIDLIDVSGAGLTMRALVAEQGKELAVQDDLAWIRFLSATWFELEDHYWRAQHAA